MINWDFIQGLVTGIIIYWFFREHPKNYTYDAYDITDNHRISTTGTSFYKPKYRDCFDGCPQHRKVII